MQYVVTNPKGVTERTGPTTTSFAAQTYASGVVINIEATVKTLNELWGKIKDKDRAYIAIHIGKNEYCAPIEVIPARQWYEDIDTWARIQGFKGIQP